MSATPPPSYTPPPADLPQRGIRATFSSLMDTWITWFSNTSLAQVAALAANAYANALDAFASATTASAQSAAAVAAVDALPWASGSYSAGAVRYSLVDGRTYRCYIAVSGSTDPANDRPHWVCISAGPQPYFNAQDRKASGTAPSAATADTWNVRELNTIIGSNTIPGASLAGNQITLPAGTYEVRATAQAMARQHRLTLYNVTDSVQVLAGANAGTSTTQYPDPASLCGRITLTSTKNIQILHYIVGGGAFGTALNNGEQEIYANIEIWKID